MDKNGQINCVGTLKQSDSKRLYHFEVTGLLLLFEFLIKLRTDDEPYGVCVCFWYFGLNSRRLVCNFKPQPNEFGHGAAVWVMPKGVYERNIGRR